MMQVRTEGTSAAIHRFTTGPARQARRRPAVGAVVALVALLGSILAATLGPPAEEGLPAPLVVLLMLVRG
jgi:hypothetical protein